MPSFQRRLTRCTFLVRFVLAFFLLVGLAVGLLWYWTDRDDPTNDRPFQREKWLRGNDRERVFMTQDLIRNYLKPGMSREQVRELLGEPTNEEGQSLYSKGNEYDYGLGAHTDLGFRGASGVVVVVEFDARWKVTTAYLESF